MAEGRSRLRGLRLPVESDHLQALWERIPLSAPAAFQHRRWRSSVGDQRPSPDPLSDLFPATLGDSGEKLHRPGSNLRDAPRSIVSRGNQICTVSALRRDEQAWCDHRQLSLPVLSSQTRRWSYRLAILAADWPGAQGADHDDRCVGRKLDHWRSRQALSLLAALFQPAVRSWDGDPG